MRRKINRNKIGGVVSIFFYFDLCFDISVFFVLEHQTIKNKEHGQIETKLETETAGVCTIVFIIMVQET